MGWATATRRHAAGLVLLAGCGHAPPPTPAPIARPAASAGAPAQPRAETQPLQLAVMAAESSAYARLATDLNSGMRALVLPGVAPPIVSITSLETAQLAVECLDASSACYTAVGRSLAVSRLLFAHIAPANGRGRRAAAAVRVAVTLFDVDRGAEVRAVDRRFSSEMEAIKHLDEVLGEIAAAARGGP